MFPVKNISWYVMAILAALLLTVTACNTDDVNPDDFDPSAELARLSGEWVRTGGNNPANNGMQVNVSGDRGTVTVEANNYTVGSIKWQNIMATDEGEFDYQELGSDGNYYDADLTLINDSTISITVNFSGAGDQQTWERPGAGTVSDQTVTLNCNDFSSDMNLRNGPAAVDYIIPCVMDATADITVEAGTVIHVEENGGIGVYGEGSLKMLGTASEPIVIRGTSSIAGWWRGIHVESNTVNNQFDNVRIEHAGSNYVYCCNEVASLFIKDGKMSIKNTEIRQGAEYGIVVRNAAALTDYENVTITTHDGAAGLAPLNRIAEMDGTGSSYIGNGENYFEVDDVRVSADITIEPIDIPYLLPNRVIDVTEPLTLEAGVEFAVTENGGVGVYDNGALTVNGTALDPVVFRGKESTSGYWRGIHIETNSLRNELTHLEISDAGSDYVYCCNTVASIYFKNGKCKLDNVTLRNGASYGIAAADAFEFTGYSNLTITTHAEAPLRLAVEEVDGLDGEGSNYAGNDEDYILIYRSTLEDAISWPKTNVPYLVDGSTVLDIKERITFEPGVDVMFGENAGLGVYDDGIFNAEGTASDPITFRGREATQGYWRGIHIETNSQSNVIRNATIRDGGSNYVYCCNDKANIFLKSGQLTVENSTISNSEGCGIFARASATLNESGNTFSNNADGNICN